MRLVPGTDTVPNAVNKYLLPHEHQVITVRKHPAVLLRPIVVVLVGLVIAAVISATVGRHQGAVVGFVWIAWAIPLIWLVFKVWEWSQDYFIVTSRRMLLATGVITRKVAMMPLVKVTDMSFQRTTLGRLLGYGEFILESAARSRRCGWWTISRTPNSSTSRCAGSSSPAKKKTATTTSESLHRFPLPRDSCDRMRSSFFFFFFSAAGVSPPFVTQSN